jgi:hypothetical protein
VGVVTEGLFINVVVLITKIKTEKKVAKEHKQEYFITTVDASDGFGFAEIVLDPASPPNKDNYPKPGQWWSLTCRLHPSGLVAIFMRPVVDLNMIPWHFVRAYSQSLGGMGLLQESPVVPGDVPAAAATSQPAMKQLTLPSFAPPPPPHPVPPSTRNDPTIMTTIREIILSQLSDGSRETNELRETCKAIMGPAANDTIYGAVVGDIFVKKIIKIETKATGTFISLASAST